MSEVVKKNRVAIALQILSSFVWCALAYVMHVRNENALFILTLVFIFLRMNRRAIKDFTKLRDRYRSNN